MLRTDSRESARAFDCFLHTGGERAIIGGLTSMNLPYTKDGLKTTDNIPVSNNKVFKFYDHGKNDISKVSIIKITKIN
jgi:hypothetical protein